MKTIAIVLYSILLFQITKAQKRIQHVNPFIGTGGHGHTFPGATRPFGMVQLSPDTFNEGWDWCSGYHDSDRSIMGFSHTHLSGTGRGDLLDILVMPGTGAIKLKPGSRSNPGEGYRSRFKKENEKASPGYYSVLLDDYGIKAELTASKRVGFHRYTFPASKESHILFDLFHSFKTDSVINTWIRIDNDSTITGFRKTRGWGEGTEKDFVSEEIWFVARFSKPFKSSAIARGQVLSATEKSASGRDLKAVLNFDTKAEEALMVKVGISYTDENGAFNNLREEVRHWNFDRVRHEAAQEWEESLSAIDVNDGGAEEKSIFYTALYHSMIAPTVFSDADGRYMGFDKKIHHAQNFENYSVFSLWDTFRAANPLFTITQPSRINDFINAMLAQYKEYGLLPVWPLVGSETNCMIGYHAIPVITDAYFKGFRGFDVNLAYEAMKKSAMQDEFGIAHLKKYNYVPADLENKSVSKTLEYAYDDWCIAQMAKALGEMNDYNYFLKRSEAYKNVYDTQTGFMRGKDSKGNFIPGFDPAFASYGKSDFIEGNSWQYSWFVPHNVNGLIDLMGGRESFSKRLDALFSQKSADISGKPIDITGLIGEYAHGNEPSHHIAYLYNYAGQPWKTQEKVREIRSILYGSKADGLCGNEDCGQMSAWYIFSGLGFYPVNPASGRYNIGSPLFKEAAIKLGDKSFLITAKNLSSINIYIQSVTLNGEDLKRSWINHDEIVKGGKLEFNMGAKPGRNWAASETPAPEK
ncbi:GH92 family glycosyl hydrolase [Desertivirga xinjiangensis]|uniref:GH92 family glycosyl hydrolase n=1 Tax=Desertivirga xinjiangensis TaxID=539206 RepID=UPI00210A6FD8|nr:GH92 family glycosyl hydrolase [Pedobacter xinjiangensis]